MRAPEAVEGPALRLRLVRAEDAAYIHGLRTDPRLNAHLSPVTGTAEDQRAWIEAYKAREAEGREAYYVIERRRDGVRCGTVRLYGIEGDRFTWGSWILDAGKTPKAALESAVLVYDIAFGALGLGLAQFDVRRENHRTIAFHERFGAREVAQDALDRFYEIAAEEFRERRAGLMGIVEKASTGDE